MSFVTIGLLWGIPLVGIPIVLHLVMRQQPKHLQFPALRFIRQRQHANRRKLQLRHLLLLLLRCAAIALLALALARPSIKQTGLIDQEAPIAAALVFDTSPRMDYQHENKTRLQAAQEIAETLLKELPPGSELGVVDSGNVLPAFSSDLGGAKQRIGRLQTSPAAQPLLSVIEQACQMLAESEKQRKEIFVFTDLARSSWSSEQGGQLKARLEKLKDFGIYLIDIGVEEPQNFGLEELKLTPGEVISRNSPLRIEAKLSRVGPAAERTVGLFLLDKSGKPVQRDQQTQFFTPQARGLVEFQLGGLEPGTHQGYVKIIGEDALAVDDTRYFSVEVRAPWKVLLVAEAPAGRYAYNLDQALAPEAFVKSGEARFDNQVVSFSQLPQQNLDDFSAVCLLDPPPLADESWQKLREFAEKGGGVGIFLGRHAQSAEAFNTPGALELLAGPLVRVWEHQDESLAPRNSEHPVLAKFQRISTSVPWSAFPVFQFWQLGPPPEKSAGAATIIAFRNGKPALVERGVGRGRVVTMTTPASELASDKRAWNQLATGFEPWPFMMLENELVLYLARRGDARLGYDAGELATVSLPPDRKESVFALTTPRGEHIPQAVDAKQNSVGISATNDLGNYRLEAGGETGIRRGFSVNCRPDLTQLERTTEPELKSLFGDIEFRIAHTQEQIDRAVSVGRVGRELYPILILAVALVLIFEQLLSNLFYRNQAPRDSEKNVTEGFGPLDVPPVPMALAP